MKIIAAVLLLWITASSCHKALYDYDYKGEPNFKNIYLVDTISIKEPIIVEYQGGRFVVSRHLLDTVKINDKFLLRPDVFIWGKDFYGDFVRDYGAKILTYPNEGNCKIETSNFNKIKSDEVTFYEYNPKSPRFILGLINGNFYNQSYNGWDVTYHPIRNKDLKNTFYKIVYPLCD